MEEGSEFGVYLQSHRDDGLERIAFAPILVLEISAGLQAVQQQGLKGASLVVIWMNLLVGVAGRHSIAGGLDQTREDTRNSFLELRWRTRRSLRRTRTRNGRRLRTEKEKVMCWVHAGRRLECRSILLTFIVLSLRDRRSCSWYLPPAVEVRHGWKEDTTRKGWLR